MLCIKIVLLSNSNVMKCTFPGSVIKWLSANQATVRYSTLLQHYIARHYAVLME